MKYCKPKLSFFIFTSYERSECFIFGVKRKMLHNEVASSEKAGPDWVKHAFRRMKHFAALPQNMKHRRCGMKQSLFRLHIFCLEIKAKKNGGERGIRTLDTHEEYNDFRDRRLRPLSQLSAYYPVIYTHLGCFANFFYKNMQNYPIYRSA